mmetsp:Transcript_26746/g.70640  ORF Transcript_26746/g.70640 Transcript_26746/m.70640 type:complete len:212 (+) Transcript_26746:230-865(+)
MVGKASIPTSLHSGLKSTQFILIGHTSRFLPSRSMKSFLPRISSARSFHDGANFWQWEHQVAKKFTSVKSWNWTTCSKLWCLKPSWESAQSASSSDRPSCVSSFRCVARWSSSVSSCFASSSEMCLWMPLLVPSLSMFVSITLCELTSIDPSLTSSTICTFMFLHSMSCMSTSKLICMIGRRTSWSICSVEVTDGLRKVRSWSKNIVSITE